MAYSKQYLEECLSQYGWNQLWYGVLKPSLSRRNSEVERLLVNAPRYIIKDYGKWYYSRDCVPELKKEIAKDWDLCEMVLDRIDGRFIEGEDTILAWGDPSGYHRKYIVGEFPKYKKIIISNLELYPAMVLFHYAYNSNSRFEEAEEILLSDPEISVEYLKLVHSQEIGEPYMLDRRHPLHPLYRVVIFPTRVGEPF